MMKINQGQLENRITSGEEETDSQEQQSEPPQQIPFDDGKQSVFDMQTGQDVIPNQQQPEQQSEQQPQQIPFDDGKQSLFDMQTGQDVIPESTNSSQNNNQSNNLQLILTCHNNKEQDCDPLSGLCSFPSSSSSIDDDIGNTTTTTTTTPMNLTTTKPRNQQILHFIHSIPLVRLHLKQQSILLLM